MALSRAEQKPERVIFAPGARVEIRGEEWIVRKAEQTSTGDTAVHVTGLSDQVRNKSAIFLTALDKEMRVLEPEATELVPDPSPGYRRIRLYLESLFRQSPPTDARLHRGHHGAMSAAEYQLAPAGKALAQPCPNSSKKSFGRASPFLSCDSTQWAWNVCSARYSDASCCELAVDVSSRELRIRRSGGGRH